MPTFTIEPSSAGSATYFSTSRSAETVLTMRSKELSSVYNVSSSEVA